MNQLRIPLLAVAALLISGAALAGGKTATFGSRDQLRDCMDLDESIKARVQALQSSVMDINRQIADNETEATRLVEMKKTLDRSDKAAILKFNEAAQAHNKHVNDTDQASNDEQAASKVVDDDRAQMDAKCSMLTYRPADLDAVNRERRKASAIASAASAP